MALLKLKLFKSQLFQRMFRNQMWVAKKVQLVYTPRVGEDIVEDASWLVDIFNELLAARVPAPKDPEVEYAKHENAITLDAQESIPMLCIRIAEDLPYVNFSVLRVDEASRRWLADILERDIRNIANLAYAKGRSDVQEELRHVLQD